VINDRLSLFPILFGLLGWPPPDPPAPRSPSRCVPGALVAVGRDRVPTLRHEDRLADEYARAANPAAGTTLVALRFASSARTPGATATGTRCVTCPVGWPPDCTR